MALFRSSRLVWGKNWRLRSESIGRSSFVAFLHFSALISRCPFSMKPTLMIGGAGISLFKAYYRARMFATNALIAPLPELIQWCWIRACDTLYESYCLCRCDIAMCMSRSLHAQFRLMMNETLVKSTFSVVYFYNQIRTFWLDAINQKLFTNLENILK